MALWRDIDVIARPGCTGYKEEWLRGDELEMVFVERRVVFNHLWTIWLVMVLPMWR
jgi:hypothetical protein